MSNFILIDVFGPQFEDVNGNPLVNGSIEAYVSGTNTPARIYFDSAGASYATSVNLNSLGMPVSSGGTPVSLYADPAVTYKFIVKDASGSAVPPTIDPWNPGGAQSLFPSLSLASQANLLGKDYVETASFYDTATSRGGAKYKRDGTSGAASTIYADNSGFYDKNGDGFTIINDGFLLMSCFGDPVNGTDARQYIQYGIDFLSSYGGGDLYIDVGVHGIGGTSYNPYFGGTAGRGIVLKDGVNLRGFGSESLLKVVDNLYGAGAFYNAITSNDVPGSMLRNCTLENFSIDGNRDNQTASTQCSNILIYSEQYVHVKSVLSYNSNGQGVQLTGHTTVPMADCSVIDCDVAGCNYIGIQCSQFNRLNISDNRVFVCVDNCIDVYGEDGDTSANSYNFSITGNVCDGGNAGIFLETVQDGIADGNTINNCTVGFVVNRINGAPKGLIIGDSNVLTTCRTGILVAGDSEGVVIGDMLIRGFDIAGIQLGIGGGNVSYVYIKQPTFIPTSTAIPIYKTDTTGTVSFCRSEGGTVQSDGHSTLALINLSASATHVGNRFGTPEVLPTCGDGNINGSDFVGSLFGESGVYRNTAGPIAIKIPEDTTGYLWISAAQGGIGKVFYKVKFLKSATSLSIGTPSQEMLLTADPITSIVSASNNVTVNLVASNTYVAWYIERMRLF